MKVIPSRVSNTESFMEDVEITDIIVNLYDKDSNINMEEGMHNVEITTVTINIETSIIPQPQPTSPPPKLVAPSSYTTAISLTFVGIMQEPIATLFSSQSTDHEKTITEAEAYEDDVLVSFFELQFNPDEEDIPDYLIMSGKQFKILNIKMKMILQFLVDTRTKNSVSGVEVEYIFKSQES
ncbi:unnamed protein product [Lactuca saligna]|uniref:Uncharacterized protein n=1 Tax=Lactuca saligna TaxID=75948 RepID=A0AA35YKP2_LACSI|nr:unnamed protein product [Lactuca saligna]